jgi:hypothetical protein
MHPPGFDAPPPDFGAPAPQPFYGVPSPLGVVWDQHALANGFHNMTLTPPPNTEWYMDTSTDSHMTSNSSNLLSSQPPSSSHPTCIVVGNGSLLSITSTSHTLLSILDRPLHLHHDLVSPDIIKNLISICQFTTDNQVCGI